MERASEVRKSISYVSDTDLYSTDCVNEVSVMILELDQLVDSLDDLNSSLDVDTTGLDDGYGEVSCYHISTLPLPHSLSNTLTHTQKHKTTHTHTHTQKDGIIKE